MNKFFSRDRQSKLSNWWWTVDKTLLSLISSLILIGVFLNFSGSPAVAERIGIKSFHFVYRQIMMLPLAIGMMMFLSLQDIKNVRRIAILAFFVTIGLMIYTILVGAEIKGAKRWIRILGFSLQPSEFIKPSFIILSAWLIDGAKRVKSFPGYYISIGLYIITVGLLLSQPDVGMTIVVSLVWAAQLFISGIPMLLCGGIILTGILSLVIIYFTFPHFQARIELFMQSGDKLSYQVRKSIEAFQNGGFFGIGPGEGVVKLNLPDSHTDFILAVAGEEFGALLCLIILGIYLTIIIKPLIGLLKEHNLFIILAVSGLVIQFGIQAIINICSTLHLMPTKGMTLPFISYGGSSLLSTSFGIGMLLAITRKNSALELDDDNNE